MKSIYLLFGYVYFVQGGSLAYLGNFQKPYLDQSGVSLSDIGLFTSLMLIPFVRKIFIGLLCDRVPLFGMGHLKPYMLIVV